LDLPPTTGSVTAARNWGDDPETTQVTPALPGSYEALFQAAHSGTFLLLLRADAAVLKNTLGERLERAIGVVYRPETERVSHYFHAVLPDQFDALIHIDRTRALRALETHAEAHLEEVPETFPSGV
jgi:erythromycin esterase-like protein